MRLLEVVENNAMMTKAQEFRKNLNSKNWNKMKGIVNERQLYC